ncbi:alpha/beta hydrolase [Algiphilus sp.]|uniref:alpha/beta hydrolase n=1 Tax=Algiphilus sp. TaxID=1872431 RepID=UPI003B52080D
MFPVIITSKFTSRYSPIGPVVLVVLFLYSSATEGRTSIPDPIAAPQEFAEWKTDVRVRLSSLLGIPDHGSRVNLHPQDRGSIERDGLVIEKWVYTLEQGSKMPALLYRPAKPRGLMPAVVLAYGHGASKSHASYQYIAQLYARLGIAVLAGDPIGEEERHIRGLIGTRDHDGAQVHRRAADAGRSIMGKLVLDTMRGVDFLSSREDIDPSRIGVVGNSLGGAVAAWLAALEPRIGFALISGWGYGAHFESIGKQCTREPIRQMREQVSWMQFIALSAPHSNILILNGEADIVIDKKEERAVWRDLQGLVESVKPMQAAFSRSWSIDSWLINGGGHRPYPAHPKGVAWILDQTKPRGDGARELPLSKTVNFGDWADGQGIQFESLYDTELHLRGAVLVAGKINYLSPTVLQVLTESEQGLPTFTLDGWLDVIE